MITRGSGLKAPAGPSRRAADPPSPNFFFFQKHPPRRYIINTFYIKSSHILKTISEASKSPKTQGALESNGPKSTTNKLPKTSTAPPPPKATPEFDDMDKHRKAPKGVEYLFITISLLEKLSFPIHLIRDTIKRFRAHVGEQHCFEHYGPQFRMGPTIKLAKHMETLVDFRFYKSFRQY